MSHYLDYWTTLVGGAVVGLIAHETAHVLTTLARGLRVRQIGINRRGFYVKRERGTPWDNLLIAAAGPAANVLLACVAWQFRELTNAAGYANAFLGLFYLLPIPSSDGRHMAEAMAEIRNRRRSNTEIGPLNSPRAPD